MITKIGLDLGYANITLSDVSSGIFREPSIALVDKKTHRIISVGNSATSGELSGEDTILVRPFKNGLLFDQSVTYGVIESALKGNKGDDKLRCLIGVPEDFLPKQEKVLFSMMADAGVDECFAVGRATAALIGAGYSPNISVISVNVGASGTDVAILHSGKIIHNSRIAAGGEDFDKAVKQHIYEQGDVNVSLAVARAIKEKLGAVYTGKENESIDIEGTLSLTGSKVCMNITTEDIVGVFEAPLCSLFNGVADAVKKIPMELVEQIFENGIVLTGGGSMIYGLDRLMSKILGIPVTQPADAIDCVARGLSRINVFMPARMRSNNKNISSSLAKYYEMKKQISKKDDTKK